jgi:hypothetical protein
MGCKSDLAVGEPRIVHFEFIDSIIPEMNGKDACATVLWVEVGRARLINLRYSNIPFHRLLMI